VFRWGSSFDSVNGKREPSSRRQRFTSTLRKILVPVLMAPCGFQICSKGLSANVLVTKVSQSVPNSVPKRILSQGFRRH
jgi:hypothetical protein